MNVNFYDLNYSRYVYACLMYELTRIKQTSKHSSPHRVRTYLPLEAFAFQIAFNRLAFFERAFLVVGEEGVFGRPTPRGCQVELLPVVHPQLGDTHLIALHGFLSAVAREPVRERLERVSNPRARMS